MREDAWSEHWKNEGDLGSSDVTSVSWARLVGIDFDGRGEPEGHARNFVPWKLFISAKLWCHIGCGEVSRGHFAAAGSETRAERSRRALAARLINTGDNFEFRNRFNKALTWRV